MLKSFLRSMTLSLHMIFAPLSSAKPVIATYHGGIFLEQQFTEWFNPILYSFDTTATNVVIKDSL